MVICYYIYNIFDIAKLYIVLNLQKKKKIVSID